MGINKVRGKKLAFFMTAIESRVGEFKTCVLITRFCVSGILCSSWFYYKGIVILFLEFNSEKKYRLEFRIDHL